MIVRAHHKHRSHAHPYDIADRMRRATAISLTGRYLACAWLPARAAQGTITVYAAGSRHEAFTAAAPAFSKKIGIAAALNFAGSDMLATQIKNGAPADVFASANLIQMQIVRDAGLLDDVPKLFAKNRIVLITPKENPGHVSGLAELTKPGTKVVLAEQGEPVGIYARAAFKKMAGHGYPPDYAEAVERNVVSNEMNEKAVAAKIALGEGDAGVVYSTAVITENAGQLNVFPFPAGVTPDINYPIAAIKRSQNIDGARAFVAFVVGDGQTFMRARGFLAP
jgi:molybdate transport system substrate-binding protein